VVYSSGQRSAGRYRYQSTFKGIIAGIAIGFFAKKFHSLPIGILFGLAVGAFLAFLTARFAVGGYYFEIMLPGTMVGLIVGFATQKYGKAPAPASQSSLA
jgi:F0F1-type ATP synthase assembly protein I